MLHSSWGPLVEKLATIGQLQLVRTLISFKLRSACKVIGLNSYILQTEIIMQGKEIKGQFFFLAEPKHQSDGTHGRF